LSVQRIFFYSEHLNWAAQNLRLGRGLDIAVIGNRLHVRGDQSQFLTPVPVPKKWLMLRNSLETYTPTPVCIPKTWKQCLFCFMSSGVQREERTGGLARAFNAGVYPKSKMTKI